LTRVGRAVNQMERFLDRTDLHCLVEFIRRQPRHPRTDLGESHTYIGCFEDGFVGNPFFCGAGLTRCSVMPNGEVLGCHQVYDSSLSEGNIRHTPFPVIWRRRFQRFRQLSVPEGCRSCSHLNACQGGCWAEMQLNGKCLQELWQEIR
jgi:radical SAM protein with 4Fe4S-binding SPASM domain